MTTGIELAGVELVSVFASGPGGGNPAPIVADAAGLSDSDMRAIAAAYGHESAFVLPPPVGSACDLALRFLLRRFDVLGACLRWRFGLMTPGD